MKSESDRDGTRDRPPSHGREEGRKVLIVDDDTNLCHALAAGLTARGYRARAVTDSRQAIDTAKQFEPDLVVLDVFMPHLDGGDVAQRFRQHARLSSVPILFLSSLISPEDATRPSADGQEFMAKPVSIARLAERIEGLIG